MDRTKNISIGSKLESNDPRTLGKTVRVESVELGLDGEWYAVYQAGYRKAKIRFDQIYNDGKKRAKGWSLVQPAHPVQATEDAYVNA